MTYTVIYVDKNNEKRWKKATSIEAAEEFGKENSDNYFDLCVPLYEYDRLKNEITRMKQTFEQIETMARTSK